MPAINLHIRALTNSSQVSTVCYHSPCHLSGLTCHTWRCNGRANQHVAGGPSELGPPASAILIPPRYSTNFGTRLVICAAFVRICSSNIIR